MELEFSFRSGAPGRRLEEQPFRVLVLGNFSGHAAGVAGAESLATRRIAPVDFDLLESLWTQFSPSLELKLGSGSIAFAPRDIDDFHPDHLYQSLPVFEQLRSTRKALLDPATAQTTLDDLLASGAVEAKSSGESRDEATGDAAGEDVEGLFDRLLGKSAPSKDRRSSPQAPPPAGPRLEDFIRKLVAPHVVDDPDPQVDTAVQSLDTALAELMRELLHHPEFQALESTWRALHEFIAKVELDENLQLFACDVGREELLTGLPEAGSNLDDCPIFELLVKRGQAADDTPWAVIVGDYSFSTEGEDIALLTALGAAAAANGAVFLGAASPAVLGCDDPEDLPDAKNWSLPEADSLWHALRESEIADRIGLALPRVLTRLPYGAETDPVYYFDFEEMPEHDHAAYLWANPAFECARLLAERFTREGWSMAAGSHVDLGPLPAHTYTDGGETRLKPCAEVLIPEATMVAMLGQGLMPLVSYRDRNTAVLGRFQSIASPLKPLAGPWRS